MAACFDDPKLIAKQSVCIVSVSKDAKGSLVNRTSRTQRCAAQDCETLRRTGQIHVKLTSHAPCDDDKHAGALDGTIAVTNLTTAYDGDAARRGVHAGDFTWVGANITLEGRLSGITNVGILRRPIFKACEVCGEKDVMIGRLCGQVTKSEDAKLARGASIIAVYRFHAAFPTASSAKAALTGTIEGALVPLC